MMMKRIFFLMAALLVSVATFAQIAPKQLVTWTSHVEAADEADVY